MDDRKRKIYKENKKKDFLNRSYFFCLCFLCFFFSSLVPRLSSFITFLTPVASAASPQICFNNRCFNVEVVDTDAARARGLQGRASLEPDQGMLFVFDKESLYNFWMKDTLIPLDIIWINRDNRVVDVKENVPPCRENPCSVYVPLREALYVLELNGGLAKNQSIHVGDKVDLKNFL